MNIYDIQDIARHTPKSRPTYRLTKVPQRWKNTMLKDDVLQYIDSTTFYNVRLRSAYKFVAYGCLEFIDYKPDETDNIALNIRVA